MDYGEILKVRKGFAKSKIDPGEVSAVVMDTNILLYLVSRDDYFEFLLKLEMLIVNNHLALILPEQVINEFYNNLENVIERKKSNIKRIREESKTLVDFLTPLSAENKNSFASSLKLMEEKEEKIFSRNLYRKVVCLEFLFNHRAILIKTTDEIRAVAANLALEKTAPFFGDKNNNNNKDVNKLSMGDAVIFLSTVKYFESNHFKNNYFLTINADDFCKSGKKHELHDNLKEMASKASLKYYINIGHFINEIIEEVGTSETLTKVRPDIVKKVEEEVMSKCHFCKDPDAELTGFYGRSPYGMTWWEMCTKCGAKWYTDEYLEC